MLPYQSLPFPEKSLGESVGGAREGEGYCVNYCTNTGGQLRLDRTKKHQNGQAFTILLRQYSTKIMEVTGHGPLEMTDEAAPISLTTEEEPSLSSDFFADKSDNNVDPLRYRGAPSGVFLRDKYKQ